jgi:hypothetical protein
MQNSLNSEIGNVRTVEGATKKNNCYADGVELTQHICSLLTFRECGMYVVAATCTHMPVKVLSRDVPW